MRQKILSCHWVGLDRRSSRIKNDGLGQTALPWFLILLLFNPGSAFATNNANILFIAVDDLNDWVGHLGGHPQAKTPNIDRLAGKGVSFTKAYCPAPLCNPSRISLLTGIQPSNSGIYGNGEQLRDRLPDAVTLMQYLRQHGYSAKGGGKIQIPVT